MRREQYGRAGPVDVISNVDHSSCERNVNYTGLERHNTYWLRRSRQCLDKKLRTRMRTDSEIPPRGHVVATLESRDDTQRVHRRRSRPPL